MSKGASVAGKSRIYTILILAIVVLAAAGCSSPVGSIGVIDSSMTSGLLKAVPQKEAYQVGDFFRQTEDYLKVYIIRGDDEEAVPLNKCDIWVTEQSGTSLVTTPVTTSGYEFKAEGTAVIRVRHIELGLEDTFDIEVLPPGGVGNHTSGIQIEWAHQK